MIPVGPFVLLAIGLCLMFLTVGALHTIGVICAVIGAVLAVLALVRL